MEIINLFVVAEFLLISSWFYFLGGLLAKRMKTCVHPVVLGVSALYLFFLITLDVKMALIVLGVIGTLAALLQVRKMPIRPFVGFLVLGLVLFLVICQHPILGWDTRSIWFFHAKIMHFFRGGEMMRELGRPDFAFSHSDYPKLQPFLSALFASPFTEWKEQVAKASLALLWIPVFSELFLLKNLKIKTIAIFCVLMLSGGHIIAGMTDWLIACYALIAFLIWHEDEARWLDAAVYLSLPLLIKTEGLVISTLGIGLIFLFQSKMKIASLLQNLKKVLVVIGVPLICFLVWKFLCKNYSIQNYLTHDPGAAVTRFVQRISDGGKSFWIFGDAFGYYNKVIKNLMYIGLVYRLLVWKPFARSEWAVGLFCGFYFLFLFLVYMATPFDLDWHLSTSVERTAFPIFLLAVVFLVIRDNDPAKRL